MHRLRDSLRVRTIVFGLLTLLAASFCLAHIRVETPEQRALAKLKAMSAKGEWLGSLTSLFGEARSSARDTAALSSLKQLSMGVELYEADCDDQFPPMKTDKRFHDATFPYVKVESYFIGLRRAFRFAGASNVVMSLVKVPDEPTRAFMVDFYGGLRSGEAYLPAFHAAQLKALEREGPKGGLSWAAFIFSK